MTREELNEMKTILRKGKKMKGIEIDERPEVVKEGYHLSPVVFANNHIGWEFVEDDTNNDKVEDGSYTKPYFYSIGDEVVMCNWYTNGNDIWECIKSGMPYGFDDKEYFDIIVV